MERGGSFLYLYFFIAASLPSTLSISLLRGVSPLEEKYFESVVIACRDGSKSFPRSRLNDGFCDCLDGTDEPGTSACPESKFYCVNIGSTPQLLFSSRVNDHICDCCDGSDEYDSGTYCRNTCVMDENLSKNNVKYNTKINIDDTSTIKRKNRSNLEDLIKNLKELKLLVMMEVVLVCCVIMFGFSRLQIRSRRRQHH